MELTVWQYVGLGAGFVAILIVGLLINDRDKARRLQLQKEELGPLGFVHLPRESTRGKRLGFLFLLPREARVWLHFRCRRSKGPEQHFAEMWEHKGEDHTIQYTVLAQRHEGLSLPVFFMRPENLLDSLAASLGMDDIDLPGQTVFSTVFHLSGSDRRAVRRLFQGELAATLAPRRRWWISGGGEWLLLHRRKRFPPDDIAAFVLDARELAQAVVAAAARGPERNISPLRPANLLPDDPAPPKSPMPGA